ncbi:TIGR03086 family metal-binding protein [Desertimonas flava]|uniref:TIGR03086 family metal-binding protein n=1 Tax=Desertimonas flava TaxID=2064846 RepID=UPI000E346020|nr:TIGR03086 family metal-binding protein [Desertimonas flava]
MQQLADDAFAFAITQFTAARGHDGTVPTPCADWTLTDLQNHTVGALTALADVLEGRDVDPARTDPRHSAATACEDHVVALTAAASRLSLVARDDAVLGRGFDLRGMELPGRMVLHLALTDATVHSWDVATATGSPVSIPTAVAAPLLEFARVFADGARGRAFGPATPTDSTNPSTQLVAFLGRTP